MTTTELESLLQKYETLVALSRERREAMAQGLDVFPETQAADRRERMRTLAARFPGSLRELEVVPESELERRRSRVLAALDGHGMERWMEAVLALHEEIRSELQARTRGERLESGMMPRVWRRVDERIGGEPGEAERLVYPERTPA